MYNLLTRSRAEYALLNDTQRLKTNNTCCCVRSSWQRRATDPGPLHLAQPPSRAQVGRFPPL